MWGPAPQCAAIVTRPVLLCFQAGHLLGARCWQGTAVAGCLPAQACVRATGPAAAGGPVTEEGAMRAAIRRAFRAIDEEVVGEVGLELLSDMVVNWRL